MKYFKNIIEECPMILPHDNIKSDSNNSTLFSLYQITLIYNRTIVNNFSEKATFYAIIR